MVHKNPLLEADSGQKFITFGEIMPVTAGVKLISRLLWQTWVWTVRSFQWYRIIPWVRAQFVCFEATTCTARR